MRKGFTRSELLDVFERLGEKLPCKMTVYLLGGGAMAFRNQKNATKYLDLVFKDKKDFESFSAALSVSGFLESLKVEAAYEEMKAAGIWEDREGFRFDLFVKTVCGGLSLTPEMASRSTLLRACGKLEVRLVSNEDVILFKGITERIDDASDIAAIIRSSDVSWETVFEECAAQSRNRPWFGALYNKFKEIEEKFGITVPITRKLRKLDRSAALKEALARRIKAGKSPKAAAAELEKMGFKKKEIERAMH
ncbi:Uncharacterised protein [uncultured archaeon]|nr:Uncharacterised protein [uncultured archaeon]